LLEQYAFEALHFRLSHRIQEARHRATVGFAVGLAGEKIEQFGFRALSCELSQSLAVKGHRFPVFGGELCRRRRIKECLLAKFCNRDFDFTVGAHFPIRQPERLEKGKRAIVLDVAQSCCNQQEQILLRRHAQLRPVKRAIAVKQRIA